MQRLDYRDPATLSVLNPCRIEPTYGMTPRPEYMNNRGAITFTLTLNLELA